jgi:hypothetical protein
MSTVRRILDLDPETDARIETLAARKGQDASAVVADAVELLDSIVEMDGPDVAGRYPAIGGVRADRDRGPRSRGQGLD